MIYSYKKTAQTLLFLFCLVAYISNSYGQTNIPAGNVSGTWTKSQSPYIVDGNISIPPNQKLTIEPGVEVRFSGSYSLSVQGCLNATGAENDSIRFSVTDKSGFENNTHAGWKGLRFQNVVHSDSSAIVYCVLEYGKVDGFGGALFSSGFGRMKINNTTMRKNRSVYGGAVAVTMVNGLRLKNILIEENYASQNGGAIYSYSSQLSLINCRIINNKAFYQGGAVYMERSTGNIWKSLVIGNKGGAIKAFVQCNLNIEGSTIAGNTGSPDGIDLYTSNLTCGNSILWNRTITSTFTEIVSYGSSVVLDYCIVKGPINSGWKATNTSTNDPLFVDLTAFNANPGWSGYPNKNETRSSAIDAGDPKASHDPDGTIQDIGALPFTQNSDAFPTASFAADTTLGVLPFDITFLNYSTQALGQTLSYVWDFGDQTSSTQKNPVHHYATQGIYDVKLVVKNPAGKKDSVTHTRYVTALAGTVIKTLTVSGTWTKQKSPYYIYNNVSITAGKTLTIEPGVQVRFLGHYKLNVNGRLLARGTAADSITFDSFDDKPSWHSIRVENVDAGSDSTILEYCRVAHATYSENDNNTTDGGHGVLVKNFDKVRISRCVIRDNYADNGAGVYADNADIKINDNVIRSNSVATSGGGVFVQNGSPFITHNRIERNFAFDNGGGLYVETSQGKIQDNIISYNSCNAGGGGAAVFSECTLLRNLISYNWSGHDGGGIIAGSSPRIINCTIAMNIADRGEGVLIVNGATPDFINTLIYDNRDRSQDANLNDEIYLQDASPYPRFYNCNIQGGTSNIVSYTGTFNGVEENNVDAPPLFKNVTLNDFSITWNNYPSVDTTKSPCIDAGKQDSPHDPDGSPADIGARYFSQPLGNFPPRAEFEADTLLGYNSIAVMFKDLSDRGNGIITNWNWNFGDGATSIAQNPSHEYTTEGRFDVTLTIEDENGFKKTITKEKYVRLIPGIYVKGNVSGTFDARRYVVGGDLVVESLKTLKISPGVLLTFLGNFKLDVRGALKAEGTALNPIVFTSFDTTGLHLTDATTNYLDHSGSWGGIYVYASGPQDSTVIDHCKVQFVENNGESAVYAFSNNGAAGIRISNSEISCNSAHGINIFASNAIIRNNYIHHNFARAYQKGAGIYFYAGSPKVINNIITYNETVGDGGAICIDGDSRPSLIGNVIMYNKAGRAGGICDYSGSIELINNTIAYNSSTNSVGGGYYILYAGDVKFTNNIITNNTPAQIEVADWYTRIGFSNCILEGGTANIQGYTNNIFLSENIITDAPRFVPGTNGNGKLMPGSPAINAGTNSIASLLPVVDVIGNPRLTGSKVDIGAYEYLTDPPVSVATPIADINTEEDFNPFTVSLDGVFEYEYGGGFLSYAITNDSAITLLNVEVQNGNLYFNSIAGMSGEQTVEVSASNGVSKVITSFIVYIAPINNDAQFTIPGDLVVGEDFTDSIVYNIAIPFKSQAQNFAIEPSTITFANVEFDSTGFLAFSSKPDLFGQQTFTLTMTQGIYTHSESFTFTVQPVSDPPGIIVDTTSVILNAGDMKVIPVTVFDVDGDAVTLTSTALDERISVSKENTGINQYNLNVTSDAAVSSQITLTASDSDLTSSAHIAVSARLITGLEEKHDSYHVYPNPVSSYIVVKAKENSSVALYNIQGEIISTNEVGRTDLVLSLEDVPSGVYILRINDGTESRMFKVIKR